MTKLRRPHPFAPYPYSTGEAWCRHCGMDEVAHAGWELRYARAAQAIFSGENDHLTVAEIRAKLEAERD
jgi:hypothetical protein